MTFRSSLTFRKNIFLGGLTLENRLRLSLGTINMITSSVTTCTNEQRPILKVIMDQSYNLAFILHLIISDRMREVDSVEKNVNIGHTKFFEKIFYPKIISKKFFFLNLFADNS